MRERAQLAVVVIGRNEGARLERCLQSIPCGFPVVYVDSGSDDGSVRRAQELGATVVELELSLPFTAARARNEGLASLLRHWPQVELVQFVDGDCEVEDGWLECASTFLQDNPRVAAVCGRRRERHPEASFYNRICDEEWDTPVGRANSCGGDAMFRVRVLEQVGAYDGALIAGEEPELCSRLRKADWHIWRLDAPMTVHDAAMFFLRQWWLRAVRSGYGYAQVWHKTVRGSAEPVYTRELVRALWWTVGVTFSAGLAALAFGWAGILVAPALWGAQYLRLTRQQGMRKAGHLMLGKVAEFLGALRYAGAAMFRRERKGIFYK